MVTAKASTSATEIDAQMPSIPKNPGRIKTAATWNTTVRRKDIAADTGPLLSAVKKDELKILKPHKKKDAA